MTNITKLAERLRELSQAATRAVADARWSEFYTRVTAEPEHDAGLVLQTAANELQRLDSAMREHMQLARDAVEQCDKLRARIAELERQRLQSRLLSAGNNRRGESDLDAEG